MTQHDDQAGKIRDGLITEEELDRLRKAVGARLRFPGTGQYNELACRETISHFADGVGDANPLWRDAEYAKRTRYGIIVAPPSWLYSTVATVQHGLPGVHAFHAGDDWKFYKPVLEGDRIRPEFISGRVEEMPSSFSGRMVKQYDTVNYYNLKTGEKIAEREKWTFRTERKASREKGKYSQIQLPHPWTEAELAALDAEALAEQRRGPEVRYWEDVQVGEELPKLLKGPLGVNSEMAWYAGARGFGGAHVVALQHYQRHPAWAYRDQQTGAWEPMAAVHRDQQTARAAGLPYAYVTGVEESSWMIQMLTDWMGDNGWLKSSYVEFRKFIYFSDIVRIGGKVTGKHIDDDGDYCVTIETGGVNQRGEDALPGRATVCLPSRPSSIQPLTKRLPLSGNRAD